MKKDSDVYATLAKASAEILFKEKKSKFFGQAFPVTSEDEIKTILEQIRAKHSQSNHVCYAWQLGIENPHYRANDDGEPSNSAGMPIYGQIQSFGVTNTLITVSRYFGGTKLGVGGLISAYRTAAKMALEASNVIERKIEAQLKLSFPYSEMNRVMRIIKQKSIDITNQQMQLDCQIVLSVPKSSLQKTTLLFRSLTKVQVEAI